MPSPSLAEMELMARQAMQSVPDPLRAKVADIVLAVVEFATPEQLEAVGLDNKWNLTGLYEGRPINLETVWESGTLPAKISLFRQPLLREWQETGVRMDALIRHVVIHEIGHHFGYSDDDMHALEELAGE